MSVSLLTTGNVWLLLIKGNLRLALDRSPISFFRKVAVWCSEETGFLSDFSGERAFQKHMLLIVIPSGMSLGNTFVEFVYG